MWNVWALSHCMEYYGGVCAHSLYNAGCCRSQYILSPGPTLSRRWPTNTILSNYERQHGLSSRTSTSDPFLRWRDVWSSPNWLSRITVMIAISPPLAQDQGGQNYAIVVILDWIDLLQLQIRLYSQCWKLFYSTASIYRILRTHVRFISFERLSRPRCRDYLLTTITSVLWSMDGKLRITRPTGNRSTDKIILSGCQLKTWLD